MADKEWRLFGLFSKKEVVVFCLVAFPLWFLQDFGGIKKTVLDYFYRVDAWKGNWSNNPDYEILEQRNPSVSDGLNSYGKVIVRLQPGPGGEVHGDIISEKLCEYQPITWYFFLDSLGPNYLSLGRSRDFELSYLKGGKKQPIAMLRFFIDDAQSDSDIVVIRPRAMSQRLSFPQQMGLVRDLPAFDDDVTELNEKCADVTKKFHEVMSEYLKTHPASVSE